MIVRQIAHYEITAKIGAGGMGEVYKARDTRLNRPVAIKFLPSELTRDREAKARFVQEAQTASALDHPNICTIHEIGETEDGQQYLVMAYYEGASLKERIEREPLSIGDVLDIAAQVADGLAEAHTVGIVHRDIKPANVMFAKTGQAKIVDFGLAKLLGQTGLTQAGTALGTVAYMSPEQARGDTVDERSDLWSLGVLLYEMIAKTVPFTGDHPMVVLNAIQQQTPPLVSTLRADVPMPLDQLVGRALAKKTDERYQTAGAMAKDLRAVLTVSSGAGGMPRTRRVTRLMVLPFRMLRSDPDVEFLAFSLPDAVTAALSGLESLVVRSSLTASRFSSEAPDLVAISEQADVDIVLTGTLLPAGQQLRVSTQLVEAPAGTVLWTHTAQTASGDIFRLQDDLTHRIVESLSLPLTKREYALLEHDTPTTATAFEYFLRANQLSYDSKQWTAARDLYLQCVEEDPGYAPAWARLGRTYRVIGKFSVEDDAQDQLALAEAAFKRALEINPELPIAHNLYAYLEADLGRAQAAMVRLVERARQPGSDPELFAGLVQACRYCGLLEASVAAHEKARQLDPKVPTSVMHTYWLLGDYQRLLFWGQEDGARRADAKTARMRIIGDQLLMKCLALVALGRHAEAIDVLRAVDSITGPFALERMFLAVVRATAEEDRRGCLDAIAPFIHVDTTDPEGAYQMAWMLAHLGDQEQALSFFDRAVSGGFVCFPAMARDPNWDPLRSTAEFTRVLKSAEARHQEALHAFRAIAGDRVLVS